MSKASAEKSHRSLIATLNELTKRIEETNLNLGDFEAAKRRMTSENADLLRQVQELNANASLMVKTKSALAAALDEQKLVADNEAKERVALLGKFRNMEHMADGLKENYDEEVSAQAEGRPSHNRTAWTEAAAAGEGEGKGSRGRSGHGSAAGPGADPPCSHGEEGEAVRSHRRRVEGQGGWIGHRLGQCPEGDSQHLIRSLQGQKCL